MTKLVSEAVAQRAENGAIEVKAFPAPAVEGRSATTAVSGGGIPPGSAAYRDHGDSDLKWIIWQSALSAGRCAAVRRRKR